MECKWNVGVGLQREGLVDRLCVLVSRSVGAEMSTGGNQSHVMPKKYCALANLETFVICLSGVLTVVRQSRGDSSRAAGCTRRVRVLTRHSILCGTSTL